MRVKWMNKKKKKTEKKNRNICLKDDTNGISWQSEPIIFNDVIEVIISIVRCDGDCVFATNDQSQNENDFVFFTVCNAAVQKQK